MPQPKKGPRLGSHPKHQRLLLSGLALSLFEHERIRTTEAKAKALRPYAERLITKAKKGGVHERRQVLSAIEDREVVHKLFDEIAPRFSDRNGGYTRILKLGARGGDGAPMALVELVEGAPRASREGETEEESGRRRRLPRARRRRAEGAPEAAIEETLTGTSEPTAQTPSEEVESATEEEPVEAPGDADADASQGEPGEAESEPGEAEGEPGDEESKGG